MFAGLKHICYKFDNIWTWIFINYLKHLYWYLLLVLKILIVFRDGPINHERTMQNGGYLGKSLYAIVFKLCATFTTLVLAFYKSFHFFHLNVSFSIIQKFSLSFISILISNCLLWVIFVSMSFFLKLCGNCAIPQNFYTRKLGEIGVHN